MLHVSPPSQEETCLYKYYYIVCMYDVTYRSAELVFVFISVGYLYSMKLWLNVPTCMYVYN